MSLTEGTPEFDLAESVGPDLRLGDLIGKSELADFLDMPLAYGSAPGRADLRKAVAGLHGAAPDDVVITVGGMQALSLIAAILCEKGDEVVVTSPQFPNTLAALGATDAEIRSLPLSFDDRYRLDPETLGEALSPRTRLVCLTSPQNPSGVLTPTETIWKVVRLMERVCPDSWLLIDETYRHALYGSDIAAPSVISISPRIITCASLSKCHGAPGLRLGWAITRDETLREQLILAKFNGVICNSTIDEALGLKVLQRHDAIVGERRGHLADCLERVADWVRANDAFVEWVRPHAGALCCVRLKPAVFDAAGVEHFYTALHRQGVRVGNGAWFGEEPRVFRLGFGLLPAAQLDAALRRMTAALRQAQVAAA
ncbi:MAG: pyridoxal phosphate-dependent aminotransferase [Rhodomicrobiaceae bacterium]